MAHFCGAIDTWTDETDPSRRDGDIFHEVSLYQRDRSKDKTRSASVKRRKRIFLKTRRHQSTPSVSGMPVLFWHSFPRRLHQQRENK